MFVGRNEPNKGLDFLIAQFEFLKSQGYDLTIVTNNPKGLKNEKYPNVLIDCSDEELKSEYQKAFMVIIPSIYEAFSIVALEGIANGCSVLASDGVGINEYTKNLSSMYKVFLTGNEKDFRSKIQTPFELCDEEIIADFLKGFNWNKVANSLVAVYES